VSLVQIAESLRINQPFTFQTNPFKINWLAIKIHDL
jgi:hypothetical protein